MPSRASAGPSVIVMGFLGGFVSNDDKRHPEVGIIQRLAEGEGPKFHAVALENRRRTKALQEILHWLDTDGDGRLSNEEKQDARIILFGHSWGGSAVNKLARELGRRGIPVVLTIQVDSINKGWGDDCFVPANVGRAENFYQTRGLVHGCRVLRAADPGRTQIIGNLEFEYTAQPAGCRSFSWFNRHVFKTHNAMECDPRVWARVEKEIQSQWRDAEQVRVAGVSTAVTAGRDDRLRKRGEIGQFLLSAVANGMTERPRFPACSIQSSATQRPHRPSIDPVSPGH
ncbi:MAG TPA: hypothetical protein VIY53_10640 [Acidobacteriaceae bacterium]